jgi:hypothetical protein
MRRRGWLPWALAAVALGGLLLVVLLLRPPSGLATRDVPLPPPLPSGAGIPGGEIVLRADGVGDLLFGDPVDQVLGVMRERIGEPGEDLEQPCAEDGSAWRYLGWGNLSLLIAGERFIGFISGIYYPPIGPELDVRTEDGLRLRMTDAQLAEIYGERLEIRPMTRDDQVEAAVFGIDGYRPEEGGAEQGIGGYLEPQGDGMWVIALNGGRVC